MPRSTKDFFGSSKQNFEYDVGAGTYGEPQIYSWGEGAKLTIGRYCSIAAGVKIMLGGNHRTDWITTYPFNRIDPAAGHYEGHPATNGDVVIGHDVWLGHECRIMSGVKIGNGACVGADAVVTKDIPPYTVVGGVPARVIRLRFSESQIDSLQSIAWWDWPEETIREFYPLLLSPNIDDFIRAADTQATVPSLMSDCSIDTIEKHGPMTRSDIINTVAQTIGANDYLEIGVRDGTTFRSVNIKHKHAVDPVFATDPATLGGSYATCTSDNYFCSDVGAHRLYDLIYIDGLHTFEQSLRDLLNAVMRLRPGGAIVLDDVLPSDPIASMRDYDRACSLKQRLGYADRAWMGDVYKTAAFLRDFLPMFDYATTDMFPNMLILWRAEHPRADIGINDLGLIRNLQFAELLDDEQILRIQPLHAIREALARRRISNTSQ